MGIFTALCLYELVRDKEVTVRYVNAPHLPNYDIIDPDRPLYRKVAGESSKTLKFIKKPEEKYTILKDIAKTIAFVTFAFGMFFFLAFGMPMLFCKP